MPNLANAIRDIQAVLVSAADPAGAFLSIRPQGSVTPCVVWDVSTEVDAELDGTTSDKARAFVVEARCVADDVAEAATLAEKLIEGFEGLSAGGFILAKYEFASGMAVPDDGQADAERVLVVTIHLTTR